MPASNPRQAHPKKKLTVVTFAPRRDKRPSRQAPGSRLPAPAATPKPPEPAQPPLAGKRKRAADAAAWLQATWPDLFTGRPKPLAIGIGTEITTRSRSAGHAPYAIGSALHRWTNSRSYLAAIAAKGAVRWGLGGTAVEFVSREHQTDARLKLALLAQAKRGARDVASWGRPEQIKIPDLDPDLAIKNGDGKESGLAGGAAGPQLAKLAAAKASKRKPAP